MRKKDNSITKKLIVIAEYMGYRITSVKHFPPLYDTIGFGEKEEVVEVIPNWDYEVVYPTGEVAHEKVDKYGNIPYLPLYDCSWNELMPVIEKITEKDTGTVNFDIGLQFELVYQAIIEFPKV